HERRKLRIAVARQNAVAVRRQLARHAGDIAEMHVGEQLPREMLQVLEFAGAGVVIEDVKIDANVRLRALGDEGDGRVEAGAKGVVAAKFESEAHVEAGGPLRGLRQRYDGTLQAGRVHRFGEVGGKEQRRDAEPLTQIQ